MASHLPSRMPFADRIRNGAKPTAERLFPATRLILLIMMLKIYPAPFAMFKVHLAAGDDFLTIRHLRSVG
jgi:hypothetical protein